MGCHGRGRRFFFLLTTLSLAWEVTHVRGQSGFLNIDCGKAKDYTYIDNRTGLTYTSDHQYITTGEIHKISDAYQGISGYYTHSYDLRSFPVGTRNCYTLPVKSDLKYLLRISYMYGNYDGRDQLPQFALYAGVNYWDTVAITNASVNLFQEFIIVGGRSREYMDLCLVNTGSGTPFLSALELRPLPDELYPEVNSTQGLLLVERLNVGGTETLQYPNDVYDRIWSPYESTGELIELNTSSPVNTIRTYQPPSDVLKTALYPATARSLNLSYSLRTLNTGISTDQPRVHAFVHFAELQQLKGNESRVFNTFLNDRQWSLPATPEYLRGLVVHTASPEVFDSVFSVALVQTEESTLPPIMNAFEFYFVKDMTGVETARQDVDAIKSVKAWYKLQRNWEGDPCSPRSFMWEGLNCSFHESNSPRITSLDLSSAGLTGEIFADIGNLTQLEILNISGNNLTGGIPSFLANLTRLKFLDVTKNKLDGPIPKSLLERSTNGGLTLKTEANVVSCADSTSCESKKINRSKVVIIGALIGCFVVLVALLAGYIVWRKHMKERGGARKLQNGIIFATQKKHQRSLLLPSIRIENKQFTYTDLMRITKNFQNQIGRGGFGPVYHGILDNNAEVAVKLLSETSSQGPKEFQNEAVLLTRIHHRRLVSLVGYCNDSIHNLALVYEYMAEGSLQDHLQGRDTKSKATLNWMNRLRIAHEAAQGLDYLHHGCKPSIVHRDVKTSNILLNQNLEAKIADFGLSKIFENDGDTHVSTKVVGTPGYLDPQYYLTSTLTDKSDVYSFGIVLLELVTGHQAIITNEGKTNIVHWVEQKVEQRNIDDIVDQSIQGEYDKNVAWGVVDIALRCTTHNSSQRPSMTEVLNVLTDCFEMESSRVGTKITSQANEDINTNPSHQL